MTKIMKDPQCVIPRPTSERRTQSGADSPTSSIWHPKSNSPSVPKKIIKDLFCSFPQIVFFFEIANLFLPRTYSVVVCVGVKEDEYRVIPQVVLVMILYPAVPTAV